MVPEPGEVGMMDARGMPVEQVELYLDTVKNAVTLLSMLFASLMVELDDVEKVESAKARFSEYAGSLFTLVETMAASLNARYVSSQLSSVHREDASALVAAGMISAQGEDGTLYSRQLLELLERYRTQPQDMVPTVLALVELTLCIVRVATDDTEASQRLVQEGIAVRNRMFDV